MYMWPVFTKQYNAKGCEKAAVTVLVCNTTRIFNWEPRLSKNNSNYKQDIYDTWWQTSIAWQPQSKKCHHWKMSRICSLCDRFIPVVESSVILEPVVINPLSDSFMQLDTACISKYSINLLMDDVRVKSIHLSGSQRWFSMICGFLFLWGSVCGGFRAILFYKCTCTRVVRKVVYYWICRINFLPTNMYSKQSNTTV